MVAQLKVGWCVCAGNGKYKSQGNKASAVVLVLLFAFTESLLRHLVDIVDPGAPTGTGCQSPFSCHCSCVA